MIDSPPGRDPFDHAFITRLDPPDGPGIRLAVKDCIDVVGVVTTGGSAVLAEVGEPAARDAACLAGARSAGARIVGKTNLHELCFGATGVNPHFGTPVNPFDPALVPGGSSSGSAVAVARGWADVALGTDTGGSIRNPSAFCGVAGLKTTYGRVPVAGTRPLAPSMDCIGPMAATLAGVIAGMALLEPGFSPSSLEVDRSVRVGRLRGIPADPRIDAAVDSALVLAGFDVVDLVLPGWDQADLDGRVLMFAEAFAVNRELFTNHLGELSLDVAVRLAEAAELTEEQVSGVRARQGSWRDKLAGALAGADVIALPGHPAFPPEIGSHDSTSNPAAIAVSFAGNPSLTLPVPTVHGPPTRGGRPLPASLQLVGPWDSEESLACIGSRVEVAVRRR